jgi:LacI family transcriptional regulator
VNALAERKSPLRLAFEIEHVGFRGPGFRQEEAAVASLLEHRVAAVVLVAFTGDRRVLDTIGAHLPVVYVSYESPSGVSIGLDEKLGGDLATAHLISLGHRRIAYISAALLPDHVDRNRLHGYRRALRRATVSSTKDLVLRVGSASEEQRQEMMRRLLSQPQRPTAVFAASDIIAIELMSCAHELGLQVPRDLSIVGYDDIMLACTPMIALTTIAQPAAELARRAIEMAVVLVDDPGAQLRSELIEPRLIVRKTTAPPQLKQP